MQKVYRTQPRNIDKANRSTDYQLLPVNPVPPVISSQPIKNVFQVTWLDSSGNSKSFVPKTNTIQLVEGTEFEISIIATDPSNLQNPNDDSNLKYVWRRDGAPLYDVNKLNNNKGIRGISVSREDCKKDLSGTYVIDVINEFGITTSAELILNIFTYLDHPFLYKNLLINGNGDEGLDGWQTDSSIKTDGYFEGLLETNNFGSFNVQLDKPLESTYPQEVFHFPKGTNWSNLPGVYTRITNQDNINDPGFKWAQTFPASLILNERKESTKLSSFFPDPSWIDTYNRNREPNTIPLQVELENSKAYFTRDIVKFNKYGDQSTSRASQVIDLTDIADVIDGNVYGIDQVIGQFFAYVGVGLSRYKFNVPYTTGVTQTNWYILNNRVYDMLGDDLETRGPTSIYYPEGGLDETKPVELVPTVDDITSIYLEYLDQNDVVISQKKIDGPTAEDIFAVKEKFYIPKFIETPISKGIPYKSFDSYDVYNIQAILAGLINLRDNGSFSMPSGDGRVDAVTNQAWYPDVINNALQPIINLLYFGYGNVTEANDDDFFNLYYRDIARIIIEQQLSEDEDPRNSSNNLRNNGSTYYFQYLETAQFRNSSTFNTWRYAMLLANDGYQRSDDGVTEREAYQYQQRFGIFEKFLDIANANKQFIQDKIRYTNKITIFNQPYSSIQSIGQNTDRNQKWLSVNIEGGLLQTSKLKPDRGAAAFFAINDNDTIPKGTRKVRVSFEFKHTSEIFADQSPEVKNWNNQELYIDLFGTTDQDKDIGLKYGAPRCAITSMKYVLFPNRTTVDTRYNSYFIPSTNVWYLEKDKLFQNIHDSSTNLVYNPTTVDNIQPLPTSQPYTQDQINTSEQNINRATIPQQPRQETTTTTRN
jgi:hypothetical protein